MKQAFHEVLDDAKKIDEQYKNADQFAADVRSMLPRTLKRHERYRGWKPPPESWQTPRSSMIRTGELGGRAYQAAD